MTQRQKLPPWLIPGVLYGLAWPAFPVETGWLAWLAFVPMLLRLRRVRSFGEHVRVTVSVFLVALPFVCWWLSYFSPWAMPMIWLTQGPFIWVPVALLYPVQRHIGWRKAVLLLPLFWAFWEWAWLYVCDFDLAVGGPGTTQCRLLWVNQFADLTGVWGLIAWATGFNVLLARIIDQTEMRPLRYVVGRLALAGGLWLAGPLLYSAAVLNVPALVVKPSGPAVRVALVQTNEDSYTPITEAGREKVLRRLIALGTKAAERKPNGMRPDLIVAPEGAFPLPLLRDSALFAGMRQYVQYYNVPFATGLMTPTDAGHYYNEAFVFTPELSRVYEPMQLRPEDLQVYRKQHSLAFGEVSPGLLRWADGWLRPGKPSVTLGQKPYAFTFADQKQNSRQMAIAICWEQLYPATIASLTREGSEFLTFIMNDGWFYNSPGPGILLALTQLRAIENRRSVARCSNQGYSGYVDPFGRVVSTLPRQREAVGDVEVMTNTKLTFFTRHPDWFPVTCGLLCLVLGVVYRRKASPWKRRKNSTKPATLFPMKTNRLTLFLLGCLLLSATTSAQASGKYICVEDPQVLGGVRCYKCFCKLPAPKTDWHLYASRADLQTDLLHANLVSETADRWRKKLGAAGSISLTNADFTAFASPGKTELTYASESEKVGFDMVIGSADAVNSQTWTLPADLTNQLDNVQRRDFISPASIPAGLALAGVTHATKFVAANRLFTGYRQYQITGAVVNSLGSSVDRKVGADYTTATPNALLSVLPLQLSSSYTSQTIYDTPDDDLQTQQTDTLAFDGFGSLKTPNGTFQALRYTIKTGIRTYDLSGGGPPSTSNLIDTEQSKQVGWVTKEGYWILATYANYNSTTKAATLSQVQYTAIVPTSSLSPNFTGNSCGCSR